LWTGGNFVVTAKSPAGPGAVVERYKSADGKAEGKEMELIASAELKNDQSSRPLHLRVSGEGNSYAFHYTVSPKQWTTLKEKVDAEYLSMRSAGGFVGCAYALYATSLGAPAKSRAYGDRSEYAGDDEVYKQPAHVEIV